MLGNGAGKERMRADGEQRPLITFRSNFMLAGEIPVSQHIEEGGNRETEGQLIRVLDIPAVVGEHGVFDVLHGFKSGSELSKHLVEQSSKFYGTAYIEFLEALIKPEIIESVRDNIVEIKRKIIAGLQDQIGGQADRALDRFVLAAAAGELATKLGITGWSVDDAIKATVECFTVWLNQRGGVENQESVKVLKQIREFFELHGESRFTDITQGTSVDYSKTSNRAGFRAQINDEWAYYVLPAGFKEMHKGFTQDLAIKSLIEAGWIQTKEIIKNSKSIIESSIKHTIHGYARTRVYIFNGLMWY
jgi:putative DNA primase/helicase